MPEFLYTDVEKVKSELELGTDLEFTDSLDGLLADMIEQSSRLIDGFKSVDRGAYKSNDIANDETRYFFGSGLTEQPIDYATAITSVAVEETDGTYTTWTVNTDFYTLPYNATLFNEPIRRLETTRKTGSTKSVWTYGPRRVRVVGIFGITTTPPPEIERAALIQSQRWYHRALQGWQETGAIPELAQLRYTQQLDPDVKQSLSGAFPHVSRVAV